MRYWVRAVPNTVPEGVHPAAPAWSAEYLQEFLWRIVPGRSMRSMDDEVIAEFFREHPEHWEKIWALFTVEGAMPSNGLALWFIYDAQLTICGHDLLVYLAEHFPQYRARIEQECVQALLRDYAPQAGRASEATRDAIRNDRDCEELLFALYHLNEREQSVRRIPALLNYLHRAHQEGRVIEFSPAFQKHLRRYLNRAWHDGRDQLRYLAYRLLIQHVHAADPDPQAALTEHTGRFQGADFHFRGYPRKGSEYWAYRSPTALFHEQLRVAFGDQPYSSEGAAGQGFAPLLAEPLPAVERSFERTVIRFKSYREAFPKVLHGEYEVNDSTYELWQVPGEEPATEWSTFTAAAYAVAGACAEYPGRSLEHTEVPSVALVCGWYAWAMRHNPDLLAAQYKPLLSVYQFSRLHGFEEVMQTLGAAERALGVPSYNFLAWASVVYAPERRALTAETIASLIDRGNWDAHLFASELGYLLEHGWFGVNRLVQTLDDAASLSPLAGWSVFQTVRRILPLAPQVGQGASLVKLAVELAELYGTPVEIPAVLESKMKGSTVLAKALRALAAVTPRVTEEALAAREAALALLGES